MSSLDNIYQKMVPTLEPATLAQLHHDSAQADRENHVGREVAHELNNILTIIQGYSDRLIMKNAESPALRHDLQLISDNARRAVTVIKQARQPVAPRPAPAAQSPA
jgi:signal transduction histidine kinase